MEQFVKNTITLVFCIFAIITSLLFIISEEFSIENLLFPIVIITISCILAKFPYLYRVKIERPIVALLVISFLALSIRIIWVSLVQVIPESDFYTYHTLSQNILQNNVSNSVFVSLFPHVFGFSKVLSFFYEIFGSNPITAVYFNIVLSIGILILVYYLGKNLIDANTGLAAAAIYAFWPSQIFFNTFVLTEPLYTFGVLLIICFYFVIINKVKKPIYLFLSFLILGSVIGFLKLIRPSASILLLSILIHYFFIAKKKIAYSNNTLLNRSSNTGLNPKNNFSGDVSNKIPYKVKEVKVKTNLLIPGLSLLKLKTSLLKKKTSLFKPRTNRCKQKESLLKQNANLFKKKTTLPWTKASILNTGAKAALSAVLVLSCSLITSVSIDRIEDKIGIDTARHTSGFYLLVGANLEGKGKYNNKDAAILQAMLNGGMPADMIQRHLSESGIKRFLESDIMSQISHQINKNKYMWRIDSDSISFTKATISPTSHINIEKHSVWLSEVANFYYSVFFLLALSSIFFLRNKIPPFYFVFYLFILGTVAAHMLVEVQSRYHYPVVPVFCILAATVLTRAPKASGDSNSE